jgi:DNA-binding ferritin-like protein (Dps family)
VLTLNHIKKYLVFDFSADEIKKLEEAYETSWENIQKEVIDLFPTEWFKVRKILKLVINGVDSEVATDMILGKKDDEVH